MDTAGIGKSQGRAGDTVEQRGQWFVLVVLVVVLFPFLFGYYIVNRSVLLVSGFVRQLYNK